MYEDINLKNKESVKLGDLWLDDIAKIMYFIIAVCDGTCSAFKWGTPPLPMVYTPTFNMCEVSVVTVLMLCERLC